MVAELIFNNLALFKHSESKIGLNSTHFKPLMLGYILKHKS